MTSPSVVSSALSVMKYSHKVRVPTLIIRAILVVKLSSTQDCIASFIKTFFYTLQLDTEAYYKPLNNSFSMDGIKLNDKGLNCFKFLNKP